LRVFIENEGGSRRKNTYDEYTLTFLRSEDVSRAYPFPYGFLIGTRGGDGDSVDCFVLTTTVISSGTTVTCDPIGLLEVIDTGEADHKVLAVPKGEHFSVDDRVVAVLKEFINGVFAHVPGKCMQIGRLLSAEEAEAYIRDHRDASDAGSP
jgi:inorganic pyrophosphatase